MTDDTTPIRTLAGSVDATGLRVGLVAARFNDAIVERLLAGATDALVRHGVATTDLTVAWVPGAFELPVVLERMASSGEVDALVALGCIVRGDTPHFDHVASGASTGVAGVATRHQLPVAFGVLTTDTWDQAVQRAGGKLGNKGAEAALAAVETATLLRSL